LHQEGSPSPVPSESPVSVTSRFHREQLGDYIIIDEIHIWEDKEMQNDEYWNYLDNFVKAFDPFETGFADEASTDQGDDAVYGWNLNFTPGDKIEFLGRKGKVVEMTTEYEWQVPVVFNRTGGEAGYITLVHSENLNKR